MWYGVTDHLELQFQLPYFDIAFNDDVNPDRPKTSDIGDIKFGARYRFWSKPFVYTLNVEAKAPVGFFNKDSEVVPTGDGQWDLQIRSQFGRSLWPWPIYLNLDIGYKFRFEPDMNKTNLDPGDEFTFRGEAGYNIRNNLLFKAAVDGFWGQEFSAIFPDSKLKLSNSERRILYFEPGLYWVPKNPLALEASAKISLSGKNYPAGIIYGFGISYAFAVN
ncbi:MAG: transporter [bacterium]